MTPEGKVKADIEAVLHKRGFIKAGSKETAWPKQPMGWYYMPVQTGYGVNGIPDFLCCYLGTFFAIETKAPGKLANVSPNQTRRHKEIRAGGAWVYVVDSGEMLKQKLDEYLGGEV